MASVKIVLRSRKNIDGTQPLILQIIKDRRKSTIHLGHHLKAEDWDSKQQKVKKSHPNSARLNNLLIKKLSEATDTSLELQTSKTDFSSHAVKQKIKPTGGATFFGQAELYLENLKDSGKYNQYTPDKSRLANFREFFKGGDIAFSDITPALLEKFKAWVKSPNKPKTKKNQRSTPISERTAINHLVVIRSVFSYAIANGVVDVKHYPFGKGKVKIKFPDSNKIGLAADKVKLIEECQLDDPYEDHCRNLWLTSFYFAGMRVSDVFRLKWSDFQNNRLHYVMGKNVKGGSLKLGEKGLKILEAYKPERRSPDDFVFPELKRLTDEELASKFIVQRTIAFSASRADKVLRLKVAKAAGIAEKLTMHIARHTFGNISGDRIPVQMLQKLYRHSSITTTIGYQANFIHKDADEALDAVLGY